MFAVGAVASIARIDWRHGGVWLLSSVLFGLLHGINGLFGMPWSAVPLQIGMAFLSVTALFVTLMPTGSLVIARLLHAAWDFGTLGMRATQRTPGPVQLALMAAMPLVAIIAVWPLITG